MTRLLDASPLLVAVYVPEEKRVLQNQSSEAGQPSATPEEEAKEYYPALWPVFEELYHSIGGGRRPGASIAAEVISVDSADSQHGTLSHERLAPRRFTYRLLHRAVVCPRHMEGVHLSRFQDKEEFSRRLLQLRHSIEHDKTTNAWRMTLNECNAVLQEISAGYAELQFDDPEVEFERCLRGKSAHRDAP